MPPYTPQQQFLAADQNPQDPQFSAQDHFFGALLSTALFKNRRGAIACGT